jgi:hypothetical protein
MESNQHAMRRAAAEAFIESLDKLQETLIAEERQGAQPVVNSPVNNAARPQPKSPAFDLASLEQAVEDIEQFIQAKEELES